VRDRGISCVVVAHRLSTIRDSDEIIVMNQGQIVERGKHEDLLNEHGFYEQLIMCE
jgi:ABC-type transport system involved in Fe-S cluster assembly fused permease/ATPase subunit